MKFAISYTKVFLSSGEHKEQTQSATQDSLHVRLAQLHSATPLHPKCDGGGNWYYICDVTFTEQKR